jgi:(p)ppGpp synthase/HD superfamily hydrolase
MSKKGKELMKQDYGKLKLVLRTHLRTKGFFKALKAMELAMKYHTNVRKDGQPEFSHQVSQACLFMTIEPFALDPEGVYITIFLHDTPEDYKESEEVSISALKKEFGEHRGTGIEFMCKEHSGIDGKLSNDFYYGRMPNHENTSIAKGLDRVHNLMTMLGAFKPEKQLEYIKETIDVVLPMLKKARRNFPEQNLAYENIKFIIQNQIGLYQALNDK